MARKPKDMVQLKLRFAELLRRRLEKEAAKNDRSMNSEIVERLEQSFAIESMETRLDKISKQIEARLEAWREMEEAAGERMAKLQDQFVQKVDELNANKGSKQ